MCYMVVILGRALHSYAEMFWVGENAGELIQYSYFGERLSFQILAQVDRDNYSSASTDDRGGQLQPTFVQRILNWRGVATTSLEAVEITTHRSRIC